MKTEEINGKQTNICETEEEAKAALAEFEALLKPWSEKYQTTMIGIVSIEAGDHNCAQTIGLAHNASAGAALSAWKRLDQELHGIVAKMLGDHPMATMLQMLGDMKKQKFEMVSEALGNASAGDGRVMPEDGGGSQGG